MRRISGYLTSEKGEKDRKKAQRCPDGIFFIGKLRQALNSRFCRIEVFPFKKEEILDS